MKNDDKIVELLAESLKKQDRLEDTINKRFDQLIDVTSGMMKILERHDQKLDHMDLEVKNISIYLYKVLNIEKRLNDFEERLSKIETGSSGS